MGSKATQFQTGHSGGPGRPKGSKNKLAESYLQDLYEHYLEEGQAAIKRVCEERPDVYIQLIARLIPKDLDINHSGNVSVRVVNYADESKDEPESAINHLEDQSQPKLLQ